VSRTGSGVAGATSLMLRLRRRWPGFETLDEPARLGGGEGFVERGGLPSLGVHRISQTARPEGRPVCSIAGLRGGASSVDHYGKVFNGLSIRECG
jgi:hypothetical protein